MNPFDSTASGPAGAALPFRFDPLTGGVAVECGAAKSVHDVRVLLGTRLGERLMRRDYGTRLPSLVHDPNDEVLVDLARDQTQEALLRWEPHLAPSLVTATNDPDRGEAAIRIDLNLPTTDSIVTTVLGRGRP